MSLLRQITQSVREPLPELEPQETFQPVAIPPAPLTTIDITRHHPSGGFLATFAGDKATGSSPLEAIGQLVVNGAFGQLHIANRT